MNCHVIGKRKTGKTTLLANWILKEKNAVVFDYYGDLTKLLLERRDVILIEPANQNYCVGINPLYDVTNPSYTTSTLLATFKSIWGYVGNSTPVFDDYFRLGLLAVLEDDTPTMLKFYRFFADKEYREKLVKNIKDPFIKDFWTDYFNGLSDRLQQEGTQSTINKLRAVAADPLLRNIFGQVKPTFSFGDGIVVINLEGLGTENARLIGSLLIAQVYYGDSTASVYVDGCHYFAPYTQILMLDDHREIDYIFCHQYLDQLDQDLKLALLGTADSTYGFRLGMVDSDMLDREIEFDNTSPKFWELQDFDIRVSHGGKHVEETVQPLHPPTHNPNEVRQRSFAKYTRHRNHVEKEIARFMC